jgi:hypothetical protein
MYQAYLHTMGRLTLAVFDQIVLTVLVLFQVYSAGAVTSRNTPRGGGSLTYTPNVGGRNESHHGILLVAVAPVRRPVIRL